MRVKKIRETAPGPPEVQAGARHHRKAQTDSPPRPKPGTGICGYMNCGDGKLQIRKFADRKIAETVTGRIWKNQENCPAAPRRYRQGAGHHRQVPASCIIRNAQVHGSPQKKAPAAANKPKLQPVPAASGTGRSPALQSLHPRSGLKFRGRFFKSRRGGIQHPSPAGAPGLCEPGLNLMALQILAIQMNAMAGLMGRNIEAVFNAACGLDNAQFRPGAAVSHF